jgi:hypothetical protein
VVARLALGAEGDDVSSGEGVEGKASSSEHLPPVMRWTANWAMGPKLFRVRSPFEDPEVVYDLLDCGLFSIASLYTQHTGVLDPVSL